MNRAPPCGLNMNEPLQHDEYDPKAGLLTKQSLTKQTPGKEGILCSYIDG
jgi:hypothetical protein